MGVITPPAPLSDQHDTAAFSCGNDTLDEWLKRRALKNQSNGASRSFVVCRGEQVIGYYALASGSVERSSVPGSIARNMPDPIPVIVLGRLAVDNQFKGQRIGPALLKDAMLRTLAISQNVGIRAMLVHAISDEAKAFYLKYGFQESVVDAMTLLLTVKRLKGHL